MDGKMTAQKRNECLNDEKSLCIFTAAAASAAAAIDVRCAVQLSASSFLLPFFFARRRPPSPAAFARFL